MIDFRIHTFLEVCKYMSFTKAARSLNITQPAVSQHIKYIENLYNVKLFEFSGKKMSLTPFGTILLDTAITLKHDEIYMKHKFDEIKSNKRNIKMGVTLTIGEYVIADKISKYMKKHNHSHISVTVENTENLLNKLNNGEIDFAIVEGYFEKNEYDHRLYSSEEYIGVCSPQNKFATTNCTMEQLFSETLIFREQGSGSREILERYLEESNNCVDDFSSVVEISNIHAIKHMVMKDCGITFIYRTAVQTELENATLTELKIKNLHLYHDFTFIWRKGSIFADDYKTIFSELK